MSIEKRTKLQKFIVCQQCYCVGMVYRDCVCAYEKHYKTIELEFEICECCGNLIDDGSPADTPFNQYQIENLNK